MVLHKNKWDRKATRAHVRKLKAQGKEDDTKKPKIEKEGEGVNKQGFPRLLNALGSGDDSEGEEDDGSSEEEEEGGEKDSEHGRGQLSRRKIQSNAWRYEEEEPIPGEEVDEPEPELDYVSMTIQRKGQLKNPMEAPAEDLDEDFLKESSHAQRSLGRGRYKENVKGKVVKVDPKHFEDVTAKIAKQSSADAFRQKFAPRKAKSRVGGDGSAGEKDLNDVDSFLGELGIGEITAGRAAGSREISGGLGRSRTNEGYEHDKDDDWLDSMLGGR